MKAKYLDDTDALYVEFRDRDIAEFKDLEKSYADVNSEGNTCAITFEHASQRTDVCHVAFEGIAA